MRIPAGSRLRRPVAAVGAALLLWGVWGAASRGRAEATAGSGAAVHRVEMRGFGFVPAELSVMTGDTVVWLNRDLVPHTATASDGSWDTGSVSTGDSARVVVRGAGRYLCTFHASMMGTLKVREQHGRERATRRTSFNAAPTYFARLWSG